MRDSTTLRKPFRAEAAFAPGAGYRLLPFNFDPLGDKYLLTNLVGEWVLVTRESLEELIDHRLAAASSLYADLKAKHILMDGGSDVAIDLLALKQWSRLERLRHLTGLHMFVVTLRCDHSCPYCQVSRQGVTSNEFDMTPEHARRAVDLVFQSPSPHIKIEFQGGEPLLNFPLVRSIVLRALEVNAVEKRDLQFVIASTLSMLTDEILDFAAEHNVYFSTSIDGPADLHNRQRPRPGRDGYERTVEGIRRVRDRLGADRVSALMTTTAASLTRGPEIIDEYVRLGFNSIFLRRLSPYGFAVKTHMLKRYDWRDWLAFYQEGLDYVLQLNKRGVQIREELASIILQKMYRPTASGYVDLQSPAGIGISAIVYNYDGGIYAADEGRMLAEMGDNTFRLGSLADEASGSLVDLLAHEKLVDIIDRSMQEASPRCHECAFAPYCGSDPLYHHATQGDVVGDKSKSGYCGTTIGVVGYLVKRLEIPEDRDILLGWQ
jgi:His-Xaa-Ser system radical SAM maturase HxsB